MEAYGWGHSVSHTFFSFMFVIVDNVKIYLLNFKCHRKIGFI